MATESVTAKTLPPFKPRLNDIGFDTQSSRENIFWALNGAEAIGTVMMDNIDDGDDGKEKWTAGFMWQLHQGQQALLSLARFQADALSHELWYTHALLGDYGAEAKARAIRLLDAQNKDAA